MARIIIGMLLCICLCVKADAQYFLPENRVWAFGDKSGMDFSGPDPTPITTSIAHGEGCATVCSGEGALLCYSNGNKVWGANGNVFPHGQNLDIAPLVALTTTQTALFVPVPGQLNKYYLFTLGSKLFCYRIDMSLNNGQGDVDTTFSLTHLTLKDSLSEKMAAIPGCDNNVWLIVKRNFTGEFLAYNITVQGVNTTPVASVAGFSAPQEYFALTMTASPDGNKLLVNSSNKMELLNFDKTNGKVSNGKIIDYKVFYGSCFSPNGKVVYGNRGAVTQYNLEDCDPAASSITIGNAFFGDIKLAPNNKLYFRAGISSFAGPNYLGSVEHPDVVGAGCQFRDSITVTAMQVTDPNAFGNLSLGLTNIVAKARADNKQLNRSYFDTCICRFPYTTGIYLVAEPGFQNYEWSNGSSAATVNVRQPGKYWVSYETSCGRRVDTFHVKSSIVGVSLTYNSPVINTSGNFQSYRWYKDGNLIAGAAGATLTPAASGVYSVVVANAQGCTDSAFININITGIQENHRNLPIAIYPNPATDLIHIDSDLALKATVTDLSGRVILTEKQSKSINVSRLTPGVYLLKLEDEKGVSFAVRKFTKTGP